MVTCPRLASIASALAVEFVRLYLHYQLLISWKKKNGLHATDSGGFEHHGYLGLKR
ncbi:hypothetical protein Hdeb2414_s0002g00076381 [Helianthus debilis subsp. tardiflorus]